MGAAAITLRPAAESDCRTIFDWRNDPWLMSFGSSQRPVPWQEHQEWFSRALLNSAQMIFIIYDDKDVSIGSVRLDRTNEDSATISVYLGKPHTGSGLGVLALKDACVQGFDRWPVRRINARIRHDNTRSLRGFGKAGFIRDLKPDQPLADHDLYYVTRDPN